jgi:hypothetical protein
VQSEEVRATEVTPPAVEELGPARQEGEEATGEEKGPREAAPQLTQGGRGIPRPAVKYKKVISRMKAGKQA